MLVGYTSIRQNPGGRRKFPVDITVEICCVCRWVHWVQCVASYSSISILCLSISFRLFPVRSHPPPFKLSATAGAATTVSLMFLGKENQLILYCHFCVCALETTAPVPRLLERKRRPKTNAPPFISPLWLENAWPGAMMINSRQLGRIASPCAAVSTPYFSSCVVLLGAFFHRPHSLLLTSSVSHWWLTTKNYGPAVAHPSMTEKERAKLAKPKSKQNKAKNQQSQRL